MSKEVKRWSHHTTWEGSQIAATMMALRDDGQYVSWEDYDALLAELESLSAVTAKLRAEVEGLRLLAAECDEYLRTDRETSIGSGSILHRKLTEAAMAAKDVEKIAPPIA